MDGWQFFLVRLLQYSVSLELNLLVLQQEKVKTLK